MHILLATDADWIVDEVTAALGGPDTSFTVCRDGHAVAQVVGEREPDAVITDLQVGSMGGMAITMQLRLDESAGTLPHVPVVMLLDRPADVYLAQRSQAEAWLIKPLDALRLRRALNAAIAGESFHEGVPVVAPEATDEESDEQAGDAAGDEAEGGDADTADAVAESESTEEESAPAG